MLMYIHYPYIQYSIADDSGFSLYKWFPLCKLLLSSFIYKTSLDIFPHTDSTLALHQLSSSAVVEEKVAEINY